VRSSHNRTHLQALFKIAYKIEASMEWTKQLSDPYDVIVDPYDVMEYGQYLHISKAFAKHKHLFSRQYFALMFRLMTDKSKRLLAPAVKHFF